jgi:hypothetical protein
VRAERSLPDFSNGYACAGHVRVDLTRTNGEGAVAAATSGDPANFRQAPTLPALLWASWSAAIPGVLLAALQCTANGCSGSAREPFGQARITRRFSRHQ